MLFIRLVKPEQPANEKWVDALPKKNRQTGQAPGKTVDGSKWRATAVSKARRLPSQTRRT